MASPKPAAQKTSTEQQKNTVLKNPPETQSTPTPINLKKKERDAITISKLQETEALIEEGQLENEANKTAEEVIQNSVFPDESDHIKRREGMSDNLNAFNCKIIFLKCQLI